MVKLIQLTSDKNDVGRGETVTLQMYKRAVWREVRVTADYADFVLYESEIIAAWDKGETVESMSRRIEIMMLEYVKTNIAI